MNKLKIEMIYCLTISMNVSVLGPIAVLLTVCATLPDKLCSRGLGLCVSAVG